MNRWLNNWMECSFTDQAHLDKRFRYSLKGPDSFAVIANGEVKTRFAKYTFGHKGDGE